MIVSCLKKKNPKFYGNTNTLNAQTNLEKEELEVILPDFYLYYKAKVIKT